MSSLPVKNFYQHIGEQVEALPNAVVHIENSVYVRSKGLFVDNVFAKLFFNELFIRKIFSNIFCFIFVIFFL